MYNITGKHLAIASRILTARLVRPLSIDTVILERHLIDSETKLDNYCHRFVGCFDQREDGSPTFYLIARQDPDADVSHVFIYYVNRDYKVIQDTDMELLRKYLPDLGSQDCRIKIGVVQVDTPSCPTKHLAALVETIDYTMGAKLFIPELPLRNIKVNDSSFLLGTQLDIDVVYCSGELSSNLFSSCFDLAAEYNIPFSEFSRGSSINQSSVGVVRSRGHLIYIIYCAEIKLVNYLVVHNNQFQAMEHFEELRDLVTRWISDPITSHCVTRLVPERSLHCDDIIVRDAIELVLELMPNTLIALHEKDVKYLKSRYGDSWQYHKDCRTVAPSRRPSQDYDDSSQVTVSEESQLIFKAGCKHPDDRENFCDSQATIILDSADVRSELAFLREVSNRRKRIMDSVVPPLHKIPPFDDMTQGYLRSLPTFDEAVKSIALVWNRFAKTFASKRLIKLIDKPDDIPEDARFLIYPVTDYRGCGEQLLIVDQQAREWIYIKSGNVEYKDPSLFRVLHPYFLSWFPELTDFKARVVPATDVFHQEYPQIHLLMSLYVISRLFEYHTALPQKIVYAEWEFRKYAANICAELQLSNMEYNEENHLIDDRGYLKEGAKQSLPSPIVYKASVVAKDLCMFCKRRGFNNLGRHISMAHGGQAMVANRARFERQ